MKFKSIPGYENLYEAAEDGTIWTVPGKTTYRMLNGTKQKRVWKQRQMKPKVEQRTGSKNRDYRVELWKNGNHKTKLVARLVASAFHPNPENLPCVNHLDGNSLNNRPENLEWCTYQENQRHAYRTGLNKVPKKVCLISLNDKVKHEFFSMAEASHYLGMNHGFVSGLLSRGITQFGGYKIII